jgi:phosphatidylglycerophosphate synthase
MTDRLKRIRNWQSSEFYARLVMRPLTILVMLVVADWKWLTPNLVTTLANVAKLTGALLLAIDHHTHAVSAVVWINVGLLLDHLDGTIARYRNCGTAFGAFYDKVSDAVTWLAIMSAIGWAAYHDHGDVRLAIAASASAYALLVLGYMKWMLAAAEAGAGKQPAAAMPHDPPTRTRREWAIWFAASLAKSVRFEEVDLFFWIGVGVLVQRLDLLVWLLAVSQTVQLLIMLMKRSLQARSLSGSGRRPGSSGSRASRAGPAPGGAARRDARPARRARGGRGRGARTRSARARWAARGRAGARPDPR